MCGSGEGGGGGSAIFMVNVELFVCAKRGVFMCYFVGLLACMFVGGCVFSLVQQGRVCELVFSLLHFPCICYLRVD